MLELFDGPTYKVHGGNLTSCCVVLDASIRVRDLSNDFLTRIHS